MGHAVGMIVDVAGYSDGHRADIAAEAGIALDHTTSSHALAEAMRTWLDDHPDGFIWLGLRIPGVEDLHRYCGVLGVDGIPAESLLRPHTRPVLQIEDGTRQMVLRTARYDDATESLVLGEISLLIGERAVVSIRHGQASPLSELRAQLEAEPARLSSPEAVATEIVGRVIADYVPALDGFENDAVEVEAEVFTSARRQPVQRLYRLKREVRRMLVAVDALQDPLARLIREVEHSVPPSVLSDLREAIDQLDRVITRIQSLSSLLDAALTASLAQITVQQNDDMRRISAWVAMAAVPTLIAGIYGMNFDHLPELEWEFGYPAVLVVMGGIAAFMYRAFKRSGWL